MADDFSEKLNAILGNPEAMGQIMSMAQVLGGGTGGGDSEPEPEMVRTEPEVSSPPAPVEAAAPSPPPQMPDLSGILGMLGSLTGGGQGASSGGGGNPLSALGDLDPRLIQMGMTLLSEMNRTDDRKTALLSALRPFVKEERYAKVDRAIQIAKLSRIIRVALTLFKDKEGGGQEHV